MKKLYILLLCVAMLTAVGCLEKKEPIPVNRPAVEVPPTVEPYTVEDGVFDVEAVRSNINIKGQHFNMPVKLSALGEGWEYRLYNRKEYGLKEGSGYAKLYYKGVEMGTASLENCYTGAEAESLIYSISVQSSDCDIYGIVPFVSTAADVERLLGKPDDEQYMQEPFMHCYNYGILNGADANGIERAHSLTVDLNPDGVVDYLSITYSQLEE